MNKKAREEWEASRKRKREARNERNNKAAKALRKLALSLEKRRIFLVNYAYNGRHKTLEVEWRKRKKTKTEK